MLRESKERQLEEEVQVLSANKRPSQRTKVKISWQAVRASEVEREEALANLSRLQVCTSPRQN